MNFQNVSVTAHATYAETVAMQELEIQRHRLKLSRDRKRAERDPDGFGERLHRARTNTGWMSDVEKSRRIVPARLYVPWRESFDRMAKMYKHMPAPALSELVAKSCANLATALDYTDRLGTFSVFSMGGSVDDVNLAFHNVQSALRQLERDSTTTTIRQAMRQMLKLRETVHCHTESITGEPDLARDCLFRNF